MQAGSQAGTHTQARTHNSLLLFVFALLVLLLLLTLLKSVSYEWALTSLLALYELTHNEQRTQKSNEVQLYWMVCVSCFLSLALSLLFCVSVYLRNITDLKVPTCIFSLHIFFLVECFRLLFSGIWTNSFSSSSLRSFILFIIQKPTYRASKDKKANKKRDQMYAILLCLCIVYDDFVNAQGKISQKCSRFGLNGWLNQFCVLNSMDLMCCAVFVWQFYKQYSILILAHPDPR